MAFNGDYVFAAALTMELKEDIQRRIHAHLTAMLGVEVDTTMAEYVVTMVGNKKTMAQIAHELVDFIDDHATQFVEWLSGMLATLEANESTATVATNEDHDDLDDLAPPPSTESAEQSSDASAAPAKRVISLKSVTSSSSAAAPQKKVISLGGSSSGTIRSLNSEGNDMSAMLARRSQRFGIPEKSPQRAREANQRDDKNKDNTDSRGGGTKRKADGNDSQQKRPGSASGRLSQLLGPPVNVDQAELDARDSLQTSKRKKTGRDDRDARGNRYDEDNDRDADGNNNRRQNRRRLDQDDKGPNQPPLPSNSPRSERTDRSGRNDRNDRNDRNERDGGRNDPRNFYPPGNFRGPPGYGGFAPPPFGHPMGYFPPPYGMPPYGMGFPPQGMPPGPYMQPPMPPGPPKPHYQPRAPRPFQNKTWVNPNAPKAVEAEAGDEAAPTSADGSAAGGAKPAPFMPRNPHFPSQMRPRFQNKTWVRPDPTKEEEFSSSLPQTPPPEDADSAL